MIQIYYHVAKVLKYCFSHNAGTQRNQVSYSESKGQFLAWMTGLWLSLGFDGGTGSIRSHVLLTSWFCIYHLFPRGSCSNTA